MKKIALAIVALMTMGATSMAQNEPQVAPQMPPQVDRTQMIQNQTNQMATEYGLSAEQSQRLLDLNTRFADRLPMMMMGGPRGQFGQRPDSARRGQRPNRDMQAPGGQRPNRDMQAGGQRPQRPDSARRGGNGPRGQRPGGMNFEQMQQNQEAYMRELEGIMTPEQFNKYKQDQEQRRSQMRRGGGFGGGQRPQRNQ